MVGRLDCEGIWWLLMTQMIAVRLNVSLVPRFGFWTATSVPGVVASS